MLRYFFYHKDISTRTINQQKPSTNAAAASIGFDCLRKESCVVSENFWSFGPKCVCSTNLSFHKYFAPFASLCTWPVKCVKITVRLMTFSENKDLTKIKAFFKINIVVLKCYISLVTNDIVKY